MLAHIEVRLVQRILRQPLCWNSGQHALSQRAKAGASRDTLVCRHDEVTAALSACRGNQIAKLIRDGSARGKLQNLGAGSRAVRAIDRKVKCDWLGVRIGDV